MYRNGEAGVVGAEADLVVGDTADSDFWFTSSFQCLVSLTTSTGDTAVASAFEFELEFEIVFDLGLTMC